MARVPTLGYCRRSGLHRRRSRAIPSTGSAAMEGNPPEYELFAIRYAERDARRSDHFIGGDPHDGPMPMDYFVWAAIGRERSFVIDTGFTAEVAAARGRRHRRCPAESLSLVGSPQQCRRRDPDPYALRSCRHLPSLSGGTVPFAGERAALHDRPSHAPLVPRALVRDRRCRRHRAAQLRPPRQAYDGTVELAPGISLHPVGGHTPGMQFVRVTPAAAGSCWPRT